MSLAKAKARLILSELQIDRPELLAHLKEICVERGAFVREAPLEGAEARLTVSGDSGVITVRPEQSYAARTRFSIAHELGHFELHRRRDAADKGPLHCDTRALNEWSARRHAARVECEANEFAAELLLPEDFLRAELRAAEPGLALIDQLAQRYQTSLSATARRFIELTEEACAAVFFKDGYVQYAWKSRFFEEQGYRIGGQLDPYSYAFAASQGSFTPPAMSEVQAAAWFENVTPALGHECLLEQARWFPALGLGMSLLWLHRGELIRSAYC